MSTRVQILDALSESPAGLTLKQLAEFCTDCDHDEQIVGRMIAILNRENVIHPAEELSNGANVWIFGRAEEERHEAPISLAGADPSPPTPASEAARAIAKMRGGAERQTSRAHKPADPDVGIMHHSARERMRESVTRLLGAHGPLSSRDLRAFGVKGASLSHMLAEMAERKEIVRVGGGPKSTVFGLPGNPPAKGREPATLSRRANGGGDAAISAAGPAAAANIARETLPDLGIDARVDDPYKAALLVLQDRRGATQAQIEAAKLELAKLDRAIEAMRALA